MIIDNDKIYYVIVRKNINMEETSFSKKMLFKFLEILNIKNIKFARTNNGKPYFENCDVCFNYSHSKNFVLIAISSVELGVDIEENRFISDSVSMKYLNNIKKEDRLKYWVKKESYVKLKDNPKMLYVDIDLNNIESNNYMLIGDNYIASIMYDGDEKELVKVDIN